MASYHDTNTYFALNDWLGTKRADYTPNGLLSTFFSLPYGNGFSPSGNANDATEHHFTAKEGDQESGNDYFDARYYSGSVGRFSSPDEPKYSENTDPQSWNLYAYVGNNPLSNIDPTGRNWFSVNGKWEWHDGNSWTDANGKKYTSDYNVLLRIQKTGKYTKDGAEIEKLTLLRHGENDVLATGTGYTGNRQNGVMTTPNGNYEINLNIRGGPSSERVAMVNGQPTLGAFPGIQKLGDWTENGQVYNAGGNWGDYRANLNGPNGPTHFYLHGKDDLFTNGRTWTHGCTTEPDQAVLKAIFKLNPSNVGEGAKNGRILVNVEGK